MTRRAKLAVITCATLGAFAARAQAATITVNTTADVAPVAGDCEGADTCSLRQAVAKAAAGDTVLLPASATPYEVTREPISLHGELAVEGAGAREVQIRGDEDSSVFIARLPEGSSVKLEGLTISGGAETGSGGGIYIDSPNAGVELEGVTLSEDTAAVDGGAIQLSAGWLLIYDSTLGPDDTAAAFGGAVDNEDGTVTISNSTIAGNRAAHGGAVATRNAGHTELQYATVALNSATAEGGDLYAAGSGSFSVLDSIVADGGAPSGGDCNGSAGFFSHGYNMTDGVLATGVAACGFTQATDVLGDPRLGPLEDNGGETDTEALAEGSPAIERIPALECVDADQRGAKRPFGLVGCDIGALEGGGEVLTPQWSAAHDYRTSPQENPSPDSLGNAEVWAYDYAPLADLDEPADYKLLPTKGFDAGCEGRENVYSWNLDADIPVVNLNASGTTEVCSGTVTLPGRTMVMHPGAGNSYSIVAWRSPISGTVDVAGSFTSVDPNGGEGTTWYVDKGGTTLAEGEDPRGGAGEFDLPSLAVSAGESLYFILGPAKSGDYFNDATALNMTITHPVSRAHEEPHEKGHQPLPPSCATSMAIEAVEVLADCISENGSGTFLAEGHTRFADGASIVLAGTQTPAPLIIDPAAHTISIAPAAGGGAQSGELQAGGVDVATGPLVIATQPMRDPVSGVSDGAAVSGMSSVDLSLSGWTFGDIGVSPTIYLAPAAIGGGALVDGRLTVPTWLGGVLAFGPLLSSFPSTLSGQLAVQAAASGQVSVLNGGLSFQASLLGDPSIKLAQAELSYQRAGDVWSGSAVLGMASLVGLTIGPVVIDDGKLTQLEADFSCATSKICGTGNLPTIGAILDVKDILLRMINLQGIDYTSPIVGLGGIVIPSPPCVPKLGKCPPPQPAPQVDGAVILGLLGDRVIVGGNFTYLLDGAFSAAGGVGLAPLYGGKFSAPPPLRPGESAQNVVGNLLRGGYAGVELASASIAFTPPSLLQASGSVFLPPPPFPFQFLKGTITIGIDPPHFTGEGSLDLFIPSYVPLIGGEEFGSVQALISDKGAAAEASLPEYCLLGLCTPSLSFLAAFTYSNGNVTVDINGGNIDEYATVAQAGANSASGARSRVLRVPPGERLASFTVRSTRATPNVELVSPPDASPRRILTLASSRGRHNRTGAFAWVDRSKHVESFLVELPAGGRWTVEQLSGPPITSVKVTVPRRLHSVSRPHAVERADDLPTSPVSTTTELTLHYDVAHPQPGTTVELWAGTGPHGAGGVMIAEGLPPSGAATWKLAGLASGRYWPYLIINEHGAPASIQYWPRSVEVMNPAAPAAPTGVEATPIAAGRAYVDWNEVTNASTYAITATPAAGGPAVRDAVTASQLADELPLAPGRWAITVQALNSADEASLPSTAAPVTVAP